MTKFILVLVIVLFFGCTDDKKVDAGDSETKIIDAGIIYDAGKEEEILTEKVIADEMTKTWELIFDDLGVSRGDRRRGKFSLYAKMFAKNIKLFQDLNTDLGLIDWRLPNSRYLHILIAVLVYDESSVNPHVKGRSHGEVGFMQLHGAALRGWRKSEVKKNPELGMFLGLRWLARAITVCGFDPTNFDSWTIDNWHGPLAVYNGGEERAMTNKRCETNWQYAKSKINRTKHLATRIVANNK